MGLLESSPAPMCPMDQHCLQWAREYMNYCLCGVKDRVSLALGLISVISWGVAEVPQIVTNYKKKSTEGLSVAFLMTWIVGDFLNLFGCMFEPATLPTQYYMAMLFTVTTLILTAQTIYYGHIYHRLKSNGRCQKDLNSIQTEAVGKTGECNNGVCNKKLSNADRQGHGTNNFSSGVVRSSSIPLPVLSDNSPPKSESYYMSIEPLIVFVDDFLPAVNFGFGTDKLKMSARYLSRSYTPTAGVFLAQRTPNSVCRNSIEEPLLGEHLSSKQSAPPSSTKTMLCAVSAMTFFLGSFNLHQTDSRRLSSLVLKNPNQGVVMQVGRKLLQVEKATRGTGIGGIGSVLGWGMAIIYVGGRLPQICLNFRRGNVEGLNPLLFVFALVGNATYVASILVSSLEWLKIRPNLPWLVDAGGCVLLDAFIIVQFIYYNYRTVQDRDAKHEHSTNV
ncbi:uncharacterized protein LOC132314735 [Cornus florida]|uniref:uncharacterized protein LOC132314735 n=1 Tax=Cornus florida TaxID=4283 RepID=UPI00289D620D|nr:uncharacterized protein LOC132314735 [Cornus florida]